MSYRPASRQNDRSKSFKKLQSDDDARKKRGEHLVEIRKNKRAEELQKKRREGEPQEESGDSSSPASAAASVAAKVRTVMLKLLNTSLFEGVIFSVSGVCFVLGLCATVACSLFLSAAVGMVR
jgi:hypothetical protein